MTWGFVAIGGATLGAALISSNSSSDAAATQAAGAKAGTDEQARQFAITQGQTAPYRDAGTSSIRQLQAMLGIGAPAQAKPTGPSAVLRGDLGFNSETGDYLGRFGHGDKGGGSLEEIAPTWNVNSVLDENGNTAWTKPGIQSATPQANPADSPLMRKFSISDFWNDPVVQASYQSGLDLGTKALKNAAPLTTGLDSGAALKELTKFGTDYTGNMAAGSQARFVGDQGNQFNKLAALSGIGQTAVNTNTTAGMNAANNTSNLIAGNANAQGAAKIAGANAFSGGVNSVANYWQQQQMLSKLPPNNTGGTTGYTPTQNPDWYAG